MKKNFLLISGLLSLSFLAPPSLKAAGGKDTVADSFTKKQIDELKGHMTSFLLENPEVLEASLIALQEKKDSQKKSLAQEGIKKNKASLFQNDKDPILGNVTGKQKLVVFLDPFCGHCRNFKTILLKAIEKNHDLKVIIKDFPILGHVAVLGTKAMLAAHQQGFYPQMQDMIYKAAPSLNKKQVIELAKTIPGLDIQKFEKDLDSEIIKSHLEGIYKLADSIGIVATPTLVINNEMVEGGVPLETLEKMIKGSGD